jgi:hypothetical protein
MLKCQVARSRTRHYGYSVQAPRQISWAVGPGHTFGWFKLKSDAQKAAHVQNAALAIRKQNE